jgi:hypothetical protein
MNLPMSAFPRFTSGVGGKAAVVCDRRLRPLLTHNGHRIPLLWVRFQPLAGHLFGLINLVVGQFRDYR